MRTSKGSNETAKREQFLKDLQSVWSEVDLNAFRGVNLHPQPTVPGAAAAESSTNDDANTTSGNISTAKAHQNTFNGTQLLSADKFLPDSAPCSSYGIGDDTSREKQQT